MDVSYKVTVRGKVVEVNGHPVYHDQKADEAMTDDVVQDVVSLDALVKGIHERWGIYSDIDFFIWRHDWQA